MRYTITYDGSVVLDRNAIFIETLFFENENRVILVEWTKPENFRILYEIPDPSLLQIQREFEDDN